MAASRLFIGLISGTSADGIDAALISHGDDGIEPIKALTQDYDSDLKRLIDRALAAPQTITAAQAGALDSAIGDAFAAAAMSLIDATGIAATSVRAIGSHGQTLFHAPDDPHPYTLQVGDAARIAARTGITTVADFRRADLAAGGQGAPLAPLLHERIMVGNVCRAVLNLGGIANVTLLQPGQATLGFDTGPANTLMDQWCALCGLGDFDDNGRIAAAGSVDEALLAQLLDEAYFRRPAPKSTGRELFNRDWLLRRLAMDTDAPAGLHSQRQADIMATLCELSARTIARAPGLAEARPQELIVCGGGARNAALLARISAHLPDAPLSDTARFGIDPDFVEATLFAWLAAERIDGRTVDTRHITGAATPIVAGCIHEPGRNLRA